MEEVASALNSSIAAQVKRLRTRLGLSLDDLANRSGVSRSMISLIERAESSPTAVVLERLSVGLKVPLASLFNAPASETSPLARHADQPVWTDPDSGYTRRNVSPAAFASPIQIVEVEFPAGARVAYDTAAREPRVYQQIWLRRGRLEIRIADDRHSLEAGDCIAMELDRPIMFYNPGRETAHYAVVIASEVGLRR
jgi:transcriptional regulator with XRE-family HTH domain